MAQVADLSYEPPEGTRRARKSRYSIPEEDRKRCSRCKEWKSYTEYYTAKEGTWLDNHHPYCKPCYAKYSKKARATNIDRVRAQVRFRRFGITPEEFDSLLETQNKTCAICHLPESSIDGRTGKVRTLAVDHDKHTERVRGLLCMSCNRALGWFRDNPQYLQSAINYLTMGEP